MMANRGTIVEIGPTARPQDLCANLHTGKRALLVDGDQTDSLGRKRVYILAGPPIYIEAERLKAAHDEL